MWRVTTDEPISWMALAEGTDVHSSDGEELGKVSKVIADVQKDIFSGIAFRSHLLGHQRFAPADKVGEITQSAVHLNISSTEVEELETYHG
jgi:uncharacterized protein YrrD